MSTPVLYLGWRNFSRNIHRYRVLLLALSLVVAVFCLVLGITGGITGSLRDKAARYFTGHVTVQQFTRGGFSSIEEPDAVRSLLASIQPPGSLLVERAVYYGDSATLFFAGNSMRQRRLIGVDWAVERPILAGFSLLEGSLPQDGDGQAILLSGDAAAHLGIQVGDQLAASLRTQSGQINTLTLILRATFQESSFFGYTAYLDRRALNRLEVKAAERVTEFGLFLDTPRRQQASASLVHTSLAAAGPSFPLLQTKDQRDRFLSQRQPEPTFAVLALDAQLAEIKDLLDAISLIAAVIIMLFAGLVIIGVSNTYSMLVYERTAEIGTLRALGMSRTRILGSFLAESFYLGLLGSASGLVLGLALLNWLSRLSLFGGLAWADLFLVHGRLSWRLTASALVLVCAVALCTSLAGCLRSARRAAKLAPAEALRQD